MKLKSFLKKLFLGGEIIEKVYSPINGEILVLEDLKGKKFVRVGGISQSGGMVEEIWESALSQITNYKLQITNCLILGLGCGTVAKILAEKWPGIKITGIEIDPEVIKIGKKYFGLNKIPNLKIVIGDALSQITNYKLSRSAGSRFVGQITNEFDLILVDLYKGQEFPKEAEGEEFLNGLKKILAKNGLVIFNRLNFGEHKARATEFLGKLKEFFSKVIPKRIEFNLFIFCGSSSEKV